MILRVFVYGTLLSGEPNNHVMERSGGRLLYKTTIGKGQNFKMVTGNGYFPMLVRCPPSEATTIHGELWGVDTLTHLDRLEGYPTHYDRHMFAGKTIVYFGKGYGRENENIFSGNWKEYKHGTCKA